MDHDAIRITGTDCDIPAVYGADFPLARGLRGKPGEVVSPRDLSDFFPSAVAAVARNAWFRSNGTRTLLKRGRVVLKDIDAGFACGECRFVSVSGDEYLGEFRLPLRQD